MMDDRAVSIAVSHALMIGISGILITGLLMGSATLLDHQEERAAQQQVSDVGSETVSYIYEFDSLNQTGTGVNATVRPNYPGRIVDNYNYRLELENTTNGGTLEVQVSGLNVDREYQIQTDSTIRNGSVDATEMEINLCGPSGEITLGGCE